MVEDDAYAQVFSNYNKLKVFSRSATSVLLMKDSTQHKKNPHHQY